jgi:hypothetical protein
MPPSRITLQHLRPHAGRDPIRQYDARIAGEPGILPPPSALLDFMYGVAAYRRWGSRQDINEVMQHRYTECYGSIPIPSASPPSSDGDSSPEPDDINDLDHEPDRRRRGRNHRSNMSDGMLCAMDDVLKLSMLLKGTTPQAMAAERQRREEGEELRAKQASRVKVQQWMQSSLYVLSYPQASSH